MRIINHPIKTSLKQNISSFTLEESENYKADRKGSLIKRSLLFFLLFFLISTFGNSIAFAAPDDRKIFDYYELFSDKEVEKLEELSKKYGEEGKIDIVVITTDSLDGKSRQEYLEDCYDEYSFGYEKEFGTAVLLLLNMDPDDRGIEIQGYGGAENYIHNDRIEHMLDDIVKFLQNQEYYKAMETYMKQAAYYMNEDKGVNTSPVVGEKDSGHYYGEASVDGPSNYYEEPKELLPQDLLVMLGISLVIGVIVVGIMAYTSGGRVTVTSRTYLDEQNSRVIGSRDDYIRTTTTRVKKPSNDNNSSGGGGIRSSGGGGVSSGGHSHSGGGRSF
jgi:uncharacterized protein